MPAYINPYRKFKGIFVPDWLLVRPELSPAAKLCYGLLMRHAGKNGICQISLPTLAGELNITIRSTIRLINSLKKYYLIDSSNGKRHDANTYKFYAHRWMLTDPKSNRESTPYIDTLGVTDMSRLIHLGVTDMSRLKAKRLSLGVTKMSPLNTAPTKGRANISQDFANLDVTDMSPQESINIYIYNIYINKYQKFYETYPLKKCKGDARKAYLKIMDGKTEEQCTELADKMINAINLQMTERELKTKHNVWMPAWRQPAAWLKGECWEDEVCINNEEIKNASNQRAKTGKSGIDYLDAC